MLSLTFTISLSLAFLITDTLASGVSGWNYIRGDVEGPSNWGSISGSTCSGSSNSPINLDTASATKMEEPDWTLTGWDSTLTWNVTDLNHTVQYDLASGSITTGGGDLPSTYDLVQFHFHWGNASSAGSEHYVDNAAHPLEVHFVHKKSMYAGLHEAIRSQTSDALAVLAFFFEIQAEDNPALTLLLTGVGRAAVSGEVPGYSLGALTSIFEDALEDDFYRYSGGLTTPTCDEVVVWTVFKEPIGISETQMAAFRQISTGGYGTELYRPLQALGQRTVTLYGPDSSGCNHVLGSGLVTMICILMRIVM